MTIKTKADLTTEATTNLPDNSTKDISASDVRNLEINQIDSMVSITAAVVDETIVRFDGTDGTAQGSGIVIDDSDNITNVTSINGTTVGDFVTGPSSAVGDNIATFDGVTGKIIKDSGTALSSIPATGAPFNANETVETNGASQLITATQGTAYNKNFGSGAGDVAQGNDSRLSDDRTADKLRTATTEVVISGSTAPTAGQVLTASSTVLASWQTPSAGGLATKSGVIASGAFTGSPKKATVTFSVAFADANYSPVVTGADSRSWTVESVVAGSFVVNANSTSALSGNTYWTAIKHGES